MTRDIPVYGPVRVPIAKQYYANLSVLGVFLFSLALFSAQLGNRPFFTKGEAREALVVQTMVQDHSFVLPLRNGEDIPSKPPMFHWLAAGASHLAGNLSEFSIRFPSALCAALLLSVLYWLLLKEEGASIAALTSFVLISSFEFLRSATSARVDMCFAFFITSSLCALFKALRLLDTEQRITWFWFTVAGVTGAGAVLTKGPAGLAIPVLVGGAFFLTTHGHKRADWWRFLLGSLTAVSIAVLISGIWYVAAYQQGGDSFLQIQLFKENLARLGITEAIIGHEKPFYFSIRDLLASFLPWSIFLPLFVAWLWRGNKEIFVQRNTFRWFAILWFLVLFILITISQSKRVVYFLPALPALSFLFVSLLRDVTANATWAKIPTRLSFGMAAVFALGCFVVFAASLVVSSYDDASLWTNFIDSARGKGQVDAIIFGIAQSPVFSLSTFAVITLLAWWCAKLLWQKQMLAASFALGICMLVLHVSINGMILPAIAAVTSPEPFVEKAFQNVKENAQLFQYKSRIFTPIYYSYKHVPLAKTLSELKAKDEVYFFVREDDWSDVERKLPEVKLVERSELFIADGRKRLALYYYKSNPGNS